MNAIRIPRRTAVLIVVMLAVLFFYHCYQLYGRSGGAASSFNTVDRWLLESVIGPVLRAFHVIG